MWNAQSTLTEHDFVSSFIKGLKGELRSMVKTMMPATVKQVVEKARFQELALEAIFRNYELQPNGSIESIQQIEGASKAVNYVEQEFKEKLELDRAVVTL